MKRSALISEPIRASVGECWRRDSLKVKRLALSVLCPLIAVLWMGCAHNPLTIAPTPPRATTESSWSKANILDFDSTGQIVTVEWVRVYHDLLKNYGDKLPVAKRVGSPDDGISAMSNGRFHVSWTAKDRFVLLKSYDTP